MQAPIFVRGGEWILGPTERAISLGGGGGGGAEGAEEVGAEAGDEEPPPDEYEVG